MTTQEFIAIQKQTSPEKVAERLNAERGQIPKRYPSPTTPKP